ncbi:MAG: hypothetical protein ACW98Y_21910 [Candidatus Thorarchaeota archaeon]|jgi:hypothetical protein
MIQDTTSSNPTQLKDNLRELVDHSNMSSIEMISEALGVDEELTTELLLQLVEDGILSGYLTEDGTRFYRSDVKKSDAPIASVIDELVIEPHERSNAFYVPLLGLIVFIAGQVIHQIFGQIEAYYGYTSGLVMGGLLLLVFGLIYMASVDSKSQSPIKA